MANKIKEIVLSSYSGYFAHDGYEDELTIAEDEIKCNLKTIIRSVGLEKNNPESVEGMEREIQWTYRYMSFEYHRLFNELVFALENYIQPEPFKALDAGGFAIKIKYEDGTQRRLSYSLIRGIEKDTPLMNILSIMRKMIPKKERCPSLLKSRHNL